MVCDPAPVPGSGRRHLKERDGTGRATRCVIPSLPPDLLRGGLEGDNRHATGSKRGLLLYRPNPTLTPPFPVRERAIPTPAAPGRSEESSCERMCFLTNRKDLAMKTKDSQIISKRIYLIV